MYEFVDGGHIPILTDPQIAYVERTERLFSDLCNSPEGRLPIANGFTFVRSLHTRDNTNEYFYLKPSSYVAHFKLGEIPVAEPDAELSQLNDEIEDHDTLHMPSYFDIYRNPELAETTLSAAGVASGNPELEAEFTGAMDDVSDAATLIGMQMFGVDAIATATSGLRRLFTLQDLAGDSESIKIQYDKIWVGAGFAAYAVKAAQCQDKPQSMLDRYYLAAEEDL